MSTNNSSDSHGGSKFSGYAYYTIGLSTGILLIFTFIVVVLYICSRRMAMNPSRLSSRIRNSSFDLRNISVAGSPPGTNSSVQLGVDDETLKTYPVMLYSDVKHDRKGGSGSGGDYSTACSICLGDFSESEWLRELPDCGHFFHRRCIDMWLRMNSSCPLCRTSPLPTPVSTPLAEVTPLARSSGV